MRARNPLYVMAKPPPEVQTQIAALPRNDPSRGPHLLHVTLISLYELHTAPPEWLPATPKVSWRRAEQLRCARRYSTTISCDGNGTASAAAASASPSSQVA